MLPALLFQPLSSYQVTKELQPDRKKAPDFAAEFPGNICAVCTRFRTYFYGRVPFSFSGNVVLYSHREGTGSGDRIPEARRHETESPVHRTGSHRSIKDIEAI